MSDVEIDRYPFLDYIWISSFRGIKKQGFHFTSKYTYTFDESTRQLCRKKNKDKPIFQDEFYDKNIEVNAIVGMNGSGKTTLMQAMFDCLGNGFYGLTDYVVLAFRNKTAYLLYSTINKSNNSIEHCWEVTKYKFGTSENDPTIEIALPLTNHAESLYKELKCIYHSGVMDFQGVQFASAQRDNNISMPSLMSMYYNDITTDVNGNSNGYTPDAESLFKGFFYHEYSKQIELYEKLSQTPSPIIDFPYPDYAIVSPKTIAALSHELSIKFTFDENECLDIFKYMSDGQELHGNLIEQFKEKIAPGMISSLLYKACLQVISNQLFSNNNERDKQSLFDIHFQHVSILFVIKYVVNNIATDSSQHKSFKLRHPDPPIKNGILTAPKKQNTSIIRAWTIASKTFDYLSQKQDDNAVSTIADAFIKKLASYDIKKHAKYQTEYREQTISLISDAIHELQEWASHFKEWIHDFDSIICNNCTEDVDDSIWDFKISLKKDHPVDFLNIDLHKLWDFYSPCNVFYDFLHFSWNMSSGEYARWALLARIYKCAEDLNYTKEDGKPLILLLDEADMLLHPAWQRNFVEQMISFMHYLFPETYVQIFIATHSPIMLSDIPKQNTLLLPEKQNANDCVAENINSSYDETFAANIYTLYNRSFFLKSGSTGSYAEQIIHELTDKIEHYYPSNDEWIRRHLRFIGDKFIQSYLTEEFRKQRLQYDQPLSLHETRLLELVRQLQKQNQNLQDENKLLKDRMETKHE